MAYTSRNALDLVTTFAHGIPLTDVMAGRICDIIHSQIWAFYPWDWSISSLTAINTVDGTQDYVASSNTDILRPLKMRLVRTDTSPNIIRDMSLLANLTPDVERKL